MCGSQSVSSCKACASQTLLCWVFELEGLQRVMLVLVCGFYILYSFDYFFKFLHSSVIIYTFLEYLI